MASSVFIPLIPSHIQKLFPTTVAIKSQWNCNKTICDKKKYLHTLYAKIDVTKPLIDKLLESEFAEYTKFCIYTDNDDVIYVAHFPTNEFDKAVVSNAAVKKNVTIEYRIDETTVNERVVNPVNLPAHLQLKAYGRWKNYALGRLYFGIKLGANPEPYLSYTTSSQYDKLWTEKHINDFMAQFSLSPLFLPCL